ncbi:MAG: hypothetical protein JRC86_10370 [Deltaproteobacteria bacterium]|nr:hypothetical protein [Deltaproteobacteria bacterium]
MSDIANQVPDIPVEDEQFAVEIIDENAPAPDPTVELEARNAELQAQLAQLQSAPVPAADEGFAALAAELRKMQAPQSEAPPEPGVDYNAVIEKSKKDFYGNPTESVLNLVTPVVQEMQNQADQRAAAQDMQISKLTVLSTPGDKEMYTKYATDVEEAVAKLPPSATAYQTALKQVEMFHSKDIIAEQVAEQVAAAIAQATTAAQAVVQPAPRQAPRPMSLASMPQTAPPPANNNSLTSGQWRDIQQQALVKGFDLGTEKNLTADGVWAIEYYKKNGGRL